jgi:electron transport complex protein RnfB
VHPLRLPRCRGYAEAIASGAAAINRCPPGGAEGILRLAALTGQPVQPLDADCGQEGPRGVALIDEAWCIGCTLCLDACPVDAILGAHKRMHTVIDQRLHRLRTVPAGLPGGLHPHAAGHRHGLTGWQAWSPARPQTPLARYRFHQQRVRPHHARARRPPGRQGRGQAGRPGRPQPHTDPAVLDRKRAVIEAALARARAQARPADLEDPPA